MARRSVINARSCINIGDITYDYRTRSRSGAPTTPPSCWSARPPRRATASTAPTSTRWISRRHYNFNDNAYLRFVEKIKDAVDPNGVLSPGKQGIWPEHLRPSPEREFLVSVPEPGAKMIDYAVEGQVAVITLNRPQARNAQNEVFLSELDDAWISAERDDRVRVIVLHAEGPHFSAGHDLKTTIATPTGAMERSPTRISPAPTAGRCAASSMPVTAGARCRSPRSPRCTVPASGRG